MSVLCALPGTSHASETLLRSPTHLLALFRASAGRGPCPCSRIACCSWSKAFQHCSVDRFFVVAADHVVYVSAVLARETVHPLRLEALLLSGDCNTARASLFCSIA